MRGLHRMGWHCLEHFGGVDGGGESASKQKPLRVQYSEKLYTRSSWVNHRLIHPFCSGAEQSSLKKGQTFLVSFTCVCTVVIYTEQCLLLVCSQHSSEPANNIGCRSTGQSREDPMALFKHPARCSRSRNCPVHRLCHTTSTRRAIRNVGR